MGKVEIGPIIGLTLFIRTKRGKIHHGGVTFREGGTIIIQPKEGRRILILEKNIAKIGKTEEEVKE